MFFGGHLLANKIISTKELIDAVIFQLEKTPSLLRVIRDTGILEEKKIIELIDCAISGQKTIAEVLEEKEMLSSQEIRNLFEKQFKEGPSLTEILVEQRIILPENLKKYMQEYLDQKEKKISPQIHSAALESLKELENVSQEDIAELERKSSSKRPHLNTAEEFTKIFGLEAYNRIKFQIKNIEKEPDVSKSLDSINREFSLLMAIGAGGRGGISLIVRLLQIWADILENAKGKKLDLAVLSAGLENALDLIWAIGTYISKEGYHEDRGQKFLENPHQRQCYKNNVSLAKAVVQNIHRDNAA